MKVCVIGTRGFPQIEGGVEKHCELLYTSLAKKIKVILFRRRSYVKSEAVFENIEFIDLPSTRIRGLETVFHSFIATLKAIIIRPDVVHFHNIGPALFALLIKLFKIPIVLTYHSPNYEHDKWGKVAKIILLISEKVALTCADKIIFVNRFQMEKHTIETRKKSIYIPNGIPQPYFSEEHGFLDEISVLPGKYILSVGRITPEKGYDILIKGYVMAMLKGYKLVIVGGVEFENTYMKKLKKLSRGAEVVFTGAVYGDNLVQLYTNAAIYVLSSKNEGFPLVLLEAMSYHLDVLVSDIPATHLVKLKENDYYTQGDYKELGNKLRSKIENIKRREYKLKEFNWRKISEQVFKIYEDLST